MENEDTDLSEKIRRLDRFPGNLAEYNLLKQAEHVPLDTGKPEKYAWVWDLVSNTDYGLWGKLIDSGCVGLIHFCFEDKTNALDPYSHPGVGYGVPVKRKE